MFRLVTCVNTDRTILNLPKSLSCNSESLEFPHVNCAVTLIWVEVIFLKRNGCSGQVFPFNDINQDQSHR